MHYRSRHAFATFALLALFTSPASARSVNGSTGAPAPSAAPPLNVVLIVADDVGADQLGCYDSLYPNAPDPAPPRPRPCTPRLDDLAARGLRFSNAWSSPRCTPTRSQILTGKRVRHTGLGVVTNPERPGNNGLQVGELTLADLFLHDAALGKWHLADESQRPGHPLDVGFETFRGTWYNLNPPPQDGPNYCDWVQFDSETGLSSPGGGYATAVTTDDAIERLDELRAGGGPWLLYVAYHASHASGTDFHCPADPGGCYDPSGTLPCSGGTDWLDACGQCVAGFSYNEKVCQTRAMTQALDHEVGRLLDAIDLDSASDTAVIFVSDNGTPKNATTLPFLSGHAKNTLYQGGINVPLILWTPGMDAPGYDHEQHALVGVADLFPTAADLAQIAYAPDALQEGPHSLAQYLDLPVDYNLSVSGPRQLVVSELFPDNFVPDASGNPPAGWWTDAHHRALRNATHKLIEWRQGEDVRRELYRLYDAALPGPAPQDPALVADPYEQDDLLERVGTWDALDQQAYAELSAALDGEPSLPLWLEATIYADFVREAELFTSGWGQSTKCRNKPIRVRFHQNGNQTFRDRAFLDFDPASLANADVLGVDLEVGVYDGASFGYTRVDVKAMPQPAKAYTGFSGCAQLFGSIASTSVYATPGGWTGNFTSHRFDLGAEAASDLEARLVGPAPWFSVGLKLELEEPVGADAITLYELSGAFPPRIHVRYRPD